MIPAALSSSYTASEVVFSGRGIFRGYAVYESGGTTDELVKFYDAASVGDTAKPLVPGVVVPKGTGVVESLGAMTCAVERGLTVVLSGGTARVTVFYNTEDRLWDGLALFTDGTVDADEWAIARMMHSLEG